MPHWWNSRRSSNIWVLKRTVSLRTHSIWFGWEWVNWFLFTHSYLEALDGEKASPFTVVKSKYLKPQILNLGQQSKTPKQNQTWYPQPLSLYAVRNCIFTVFVNFKLLVHAGRNTGGVNQLFRCLFNFNTVAALWFIKFLMIIYDLHRCVMVNLPQVPESLKSVRSVYQLNSMLYAYAV